MLPIWMTVLFSGMIVTSCKSPSERHKITDKSRDNKEDLIRNQQNIVRDESEEIDRYISRRKYNTSITSTGLRYMFIEKGEGRIPVIDDSRVTIHYQVSLLDGSMVYNSDSTGEIEFQVGKSDLASGLQEGVKLMKEGDRALFIVPSHLAYGLTGDGDKIKQYQALVIDVKLLKVRQSN